MLNIKWLFKQKREEPSDYLVYKLQITGEVEG